MKTKYEKYLIKKPAHEVDMKGVKGRQFPAMTFMNNTLVPGCNVWIGGGWIWAIPTPNPHIFEHAHNYDEIMLHIGSDPNNPEDLGAEIEFVVGGEPLIINTTSSLYVPKGVKHGPLTWKRVDKPHIEMSIIIGTGDLAQAMPAGHK